MGDVFDLLDCIWGCRALPKGRARRYGFLPKMSNVRLDLRLAGLCGTVKDSSHTLWLCSPDRIIYSYTTKHASWMVPDRIIYAR